MIDILINWMGGSFYKTYISNYHNGHFKYLIILSTINKFSINLGKKRKNAYLLEMYTKILMNEMK